MFIAVAFQLPHYLYKIDIIKHSRICFITIVIYTINRCSIMLIYQNKLYLQFHNFTKPYTMQHRNNAGWNEHVSKEFNHSLHLHILDRQHGLPQSGFIFEMRTFSRSIYHKKVKQIDSNQKLLKKTRIAEGFLENRLRDYWRSEK